MAANVQFALAPGMIQAGIIDYSESENRKMYKAATAPFSMDEFYELSGDKLNNFIKDARDRFHEFDCNAPLSIPTGEMDENGAPVLQHLCDHPAMPRERILAHVQTYIGQENEDAQKDYIIFQALSKSLSTSARGIMRLRESEFMIDDVPCGPLFLRAIYARVSVDTQAEVKTLVGKLKTLDVAIVEKYNHDIVKFNDAVRDILNRLAEREHVSSDALSNILDAYYKVPDLAFKRFVENLDHGHHYRGEDLSPEKLLNSTSTFYRDMENTGKWMIEVDMSSDIISLRAQLKTSSKNENTNKKKTTNTKKKAKSKKTKVDLPPWISTAPSSGESEQKDFKGKLYFWCAKHGKWSSNKEHTTSSCKGIGIKAKTDSNASRAAQAHQAATAD